MHQLLCLILFCASCWTPASQAVGLEDELARDFAAIKDQTYTFTGQEFASIFTAKWVELGGHDGDEFLLIQERPAGSRGSRIWVTYRFKEIYGGFFSPNRRALRDSAEAAAVRIYAIVKETELSRLLFQDPDLAQSEL